MQSKGTLGSIVAGIIAILLVLVCLFYLSFSFVGNHYENKAEEHARTALAKAGKNASDDVYNKAYKAYITDSLGNNPLYLGYTYNDIQKWGVGLGLDLKGGMNVILQVSIPDILTSIKNEAKDENFDKAIAATNDKFKNHQTDDFVGTFVAEYKALNPNADFSVVFPEVIKSGDSDNAVATKLKTEVKDRVNNSATNVLRKRIDAFGVVSPNIQVLQGKDGQILLELPGVKDHERVRELLQKSANLEFYATYTTEELGSRIAQLDQELAGNDPENTLATLMLEMSPMAHTPIVGSASDTAAVMAILNSDLAKKYIPSDAKFAWEVKPHEVKGANGKKANAYNLIALRTNNGQAALDGSVVTSASADFEQLQGNVVSMTMNNDGAKRWARITKDNLNRPVAIVLDNQVYSYPNVNSVIEGGRSQITGNFTVEEAQDLANVLKSGKMDARIEIISDQVIGPSLGQQAIESGFISFIVALVLLMIFMVSIYGWAPGLIANFGLICNLFFTLGILASFQAVLTLSGIAGIVLALGMAVDANVLIFERTKEELRAGKPVRTAIDEGYSNAFSAIFDS
ncbi:MAG: protein translocase subunit SecD, partial [Muribaculaceae bacterium]|nr:protein translocase subunit SecD [Muribaculaceae bacterium]